ncbi:MAG TPA: hypothetical protein VMQ52_02380 [Candidatus Saccharimonadales bacterium]|jgi:hypothetical protein|nr:hypothetical protein [Candidatus Saccharimonadales bacterium]
MLKDFILFIKYPYTAGVIATIWLGSAILMAIDRNLDGIRIVIINMLASVIIAAFGFGGKSQT